MSTWWDLGTQASGRAIPLSVTSLPNSDPSMLQNNSKTSPLPSFFFLLTILLISKDNQHGSP